MKATHRQHLVSKSDGAWFSSMSQQRTHMIRKTDFWLRFSETVGPHGHVQFGDVIPTNFPPDKTFSPYRPGKPAPARKAVAA